MAASVLVGLIVAGLACALVAQARRFCRLEDEWRRRERELVNQILRMGGAKPLIVERENVLRLPDVEQPQTETWIGEALKADRIQEEIEQLHPEAAGLHPDMVREMYPAEWKRFEQRLIEEQTPLRV